MTSDGSSNAWRVRVRLVAPLLWRLIRQPHCEPAKLAISSAEAGTTWRWAISRPRLPITCSASESRPARRQVGHLLGTEHEADARRARPSEQADDVLGRHRRELVDQDEHPHRPGLGGGDDRLQVLHDRRRQHLAEQGPAVRAEREQDHGPLACAGEEVDLGRGARSRLQPRAGVGLRQHREAVTHAGEVGALACAERVQVGEGPSRGLLGKVSQELLEAERLEVLDQLREGDLLTGQAQGAYLVTEVALSLTEIVGLGEALTSRAPCRRSRSRTRGRAGCRRSGPPASTRGSAGRSRAAARMSCSRSAESPFGSTTTAPMPSVIAATAMRDWVTVLPEPVAPTTSVWVAPTSTERNQHPAPALVEAEQQRAPSLGARVTGQRTAGGEHEPRGERARRSAAEHGARGIDALVAVPALPTAKPPAGERAAERDRQRSRTERAVGEWPRGPLLTRPSSNADDACASAASRGGPRPPRAGTRRPPWSGVADPPPAERAAPGPQDRQGRTRA